MTDAAPVEVRDVRFSYPDRSGAVLDGASLDVSAGETHAVMGANGAGKTTLLKLVAGLRDPDGGRVVVGDDGSGDAPPVGYAPENPADGFFAETVEREVAFYPRNRGLDVPRRVDEALGAVNVEHLRDRLPRSLSGGEQRMVSIASVLAGDPAVLALDEPTSHLHRHAERRLGRTFDGLDRTVVLATHNADFALAYADAVSIVDEGRVVRTDTPRAVLSDAEFLDEIGIRVPGVVEWANRHGVDPVPLTLEQAARREVE